MKNFFREIRSVIAPTHHSRLLACEKLGELVKRHTRLIECEPDQILIYRAIGNFDELLSEGNAAVSGTFFTNSKTGAGVSSFNGIGASFLFDLKQVNIGRISKNDFYSTFSVGYAGSSKDLDSGDVDFLRYFSDPKVTLSENSNKLHLDFRGVMKQMSPEEIRLKLDELRQEYFASDGMVGYNEIVFTPSQDDYKKAVITIGKNDFYNFASKGDKVGRIIADAVKSQSERQQSEMALNMIVAGRIYRVDAGKVCEFLEYVEKGFDLSKSEEKGR